MLFIILFLIRYKCLTHTTVFRFTLFETFVALSYLKISAYTRKITIWKQCIRAFKRYWTLHNSQTQRLFGLHALLKLILYDSTSHNISKTSLSSMTSTIHHFEKTHLFRPLHQTLPLRNKLFRLILTTLKGRIMIRIKIEERSCWLRFEDYALADDSTKL